MACLYVGEDGYEGLVSIGSVVSPLTPQTYRFIFEDEERISPSGCSIPVNGHRYSCLALQSCGWGFGACHREPEISARGI